MPLIFLAALQFTTSDSEEAHQQCHSCPAWSLWHPLATSFRWSGFNFSLYRYHLLARCVLGVHTDARTQRSKILRGGVRTSVWVFIVSELSPLRNNSLSSMGANQRDCSCKTESYKQWCYRHAYGSVPMHACVSRYPVLSFSLLVIICFLFSLLFIKKPFCIPCNYVTILQFSSRPLHIVGMECLHWEHSNHKWMPFCALVRWDDSQSWVLLRSTCRLKSGCVELLVAPHVLCDPMACSQPGSSVRGNSPGQNTGVGCHSLLQGNPPDPEIEPGSPPLQADFLVSEPPGEL